MARPPRTSEMPSNAAAGQQVRPSAPAWARRAAWADLPEGAAEVFQKHAVSPGTLRAVVDRCTPQATGLDHIHFLDVAGAPLLPARANVQLQSRRAGTGRRCHPVVHILYAWRVARALPTGRAPRLRRACEDEYCVNPLHYRLAGEGPPPTAVRRATTVSRPEALAAALCPTVRETLEEHARCGDPVAQ